MKNFKKLAALLLVLVMIFTVAGCGTTTTYEDIDDGTSNDGGNANKSGLFRKFFVTSFVDITILIRYSCLVRIRLPLAASTRGGL